MEEKKELLITWTDQNICHKEVKPFLVGKFKIDEEQIFYVVPTETGEIKSYMTIPDGRQVLLTEKGKGESYQAVLELLK